MPFLPIIAAGVGIASGVKSLASGSGGGGSVSASADPASGFSKPVNQKQINNAYGQTQDAIASQQDLVNAIKAQGGLQNQSQVFNQLQGVANGTGPNPAQAQLANATGQNVANQAALMASQRGTGANTGLIARQAAQQGAGIQQNAAGQAAALQANQSLNAINSAGGLAGQQAAQQIAATQNFNQDTQGQQSNILGAQANFNSAVMGGQANANNNNTQIGINQSNQNAQQLGNVLNAAGTIAGKFGGSTSSAPQSNQGGASSGNTMIPGNAHGGEIKGPKSRIGQHFASGGKVPAMVSPGEEYLSPEAVKAVAEGKKTPMGAGEKIPGEPKVPGNKDSYTNDTVEKTLESGGIVLPRSVTQAENPGDAAAKFVSAILSRSRHKK